MKKVLLAGASGYLGGYIAQALLQKPHDLRLVTRSAQKLRALDLDCGDLVEAELTRPETLAGCCRDVDTVISTVGITRQKDGLGYDDVDYQANLNLLDEARASGVRRFIYVSVLNGERLRQLKICDAKERFVGELKQSGLDYCVIRPNGFFSDMSEFYAMAKQGRIYLFGDGEHRINPIHGADLAAICIEAIDDPKREIDAGGPDTLSYNEIAALAFETAGTPARITHLPDWMRRTLLALLRLFTPSRFYGPIEFFLTVSATDMTAPLHGSHRLRQHFAQIDP